MMAATVFWFAPDLKPDDPDDLLVAIESPTRRDIVPGHFDPIRNLFLNAAGAEIPDLIIRAWCRLPDFPAAVMRADDPG